MSPVFLHRATPILICSNCETRQVCNTLKYCFDDWCKTCDDSLWTSENFTDDEKNRYDINRLNR